MDEPVAKKIKKIQSLKLAIVFVRTRARIPE